MIFLLREKRRRDDEEDISMALAILRSSINTFFNGYSSFTSIASLLVLPSSASLLLSQAIVSSCTTNTPMLQNPATLLSPLLRAASTAAAGFPPSTPFSALIDGKESQAILAFFLTLPFVLTFSLLAKSCVVLVLRDGGARRRPKPFLPSCSSLLVPYSSVLPTHLLSSFLLLSANFGTCALSLLTLSVVDALGLSTLRLPCLLLLAVLHSAAVATVTVVCNMAIVVAAMENLRGYLALVKAGLLVMGRATTALCLVFPANLGMAATEALFQVRVVREYRLKGRMSSCLLCEAFSIAYLHALLMVLDVIMECIFYKECSQRSNLYLNNWEDENGEEEEGLQRDEAKKGYFEV